MNLRYMDGLLGFSVGNAMGFPVRGFEREELLKNPVLKMISNDETNIIEGTWGEDTSLMIATVDSINNRNCVDLDDMATKYLAYKKHSSFTPYNEVFLTDRGCIEAIKKYDELRSNPETCGVNDANSVSALVRVMPLSYYAIEKKLQDYEIFELVSKVCSITNTNEVSTMASYILVRYVMFLLNGKDKYSAYSMIKVVDYSMFDEDVQRKFDRILKEDLSKLTIKDIDSFNSIVPVLESSMWVLLKSENFKEAIIGAVNLGDKTDTIGALTGGMAGIVYGIGQIPDEWIETLIKKDYLMDIFEEYSENKYE